MKRLSVLVACLALSSVDARAQTAAYAVASGTEVGFLAKITGGSFNAKSEAATGTVDLNQEKKTVSATVLVPADSFKTGLSMRDTHMRDKYLEASKFKDIVFKASDQPIDLTPGKTTKIKGTVKAKGVTQNVDADITIESVSATRAVATAAFPLDITKFEIPQPSMAVVKMEPVVDAKVKLVVEKAK